MRAVLDTSVVIGPEPPAGWADEVAVSAVTFAELHFGVLVARNAAERAERLRRLVFLEREFPPVPVDASVAVAFGRLAAATVELGRQPRQRSLDLLITATAMAHGASLITRNARDFAGLSGFVAVVEV